MFDFQGWIQTFREYRVQHGTAYNDADMVSLDDPSYQVTIQSPENPIWRVLGIHHLSPEENQGNHNVYVEMLCKQGDREAFRAIHWTWIGRRANQAAPDAFAGQKPLDELVNLPINLGQIVSVWTQGSEVAVNFSSNYPDEGDGNTIGHHSFFACFEEIDPDEPDKPPPEPEPEIATIAIKKAWLDGQTPDADGYIRIYLESDAQELAAGQAER